jgi:metallo-beta-lactamase class B
MTTTNTNPLRIFVLFAAIVLIVQAFLSPLLGQQPPAAAPQAPDSPAIVQQIADLKKKVEPRWQNAVHFWCEAPRANRNDDPVVEPTKVFENVYAIGNIGTVAHVIRTSAGLIMIDALNAGDVETQLLPGFAKLGLNPADVKIILVAHGHADHFGGAAYFHDRYGSRVLVAAADPEPKTRDGEIADRQPITLGELTITPVAVPGHTPGSMAFIFPVTDRGERHIAALFGGAWLTPGFLSNDGMRTFRASVETYREATGAAGVDVWMQNHPLMVPYADWLMRVRTRGPRDGNPFVVGRAGYQSFVDVMAGCTDVNLERRALR